MFKTYRVSTTLVINTPSGRGAAPGPPSPTGGPECPGRPLIPLVPGRPAIADFAVHGRPCTPTREPAWPRLYLESFVTTIHAPAVARRERRHPQHPAVLVSDDGIQYEGGQRSDQVDLLYGVLWELWGGPTGGVPAYGEFDAEVQREAADRRLCAYCMKRPEVEPGVGVLWLLHAGLESRR